MKFKAELDISVPDDDADVMDFFPGVVTDRFNGTPIDINRITITKEND